MTIVLGSLGAGALALTLVWAAWPWLGWPVARMLIDDEVPSWSTEELAQAMASDDAPLLLDVRSLEEYRVGHLPGAIHFPPGAEVPASLATASRVVAYCSVGVRSANEVIRLQKLGFDHVRNLDGSIFRWAMEERPLEAPEGPTDRVHPFDRLWSRLLPEERVAWGP
ncbi:MAG: rhodanese-like domain-containing protein [Myxococcota bacterium]